MTPVVAALSETERFDWLRLARTEGVGPRTFMGLLHRFGSPAAALKALPTLNRASGSRIELAPVQAIARECEWAKRHGVRLVALVEPDYPAPLRAIDTAPPIICVRGASTVLQRPMVAIVGSRNASAAGLMMADRLTAGLGRAGYVVVSGLARGIDARAHGAALATGTVAVLAGGHDRVYPPEHERLAEAIAEQGAIVSEMPFAWEARGRDFPRRNRIVSGLCMATIVVEAARRSGSLITARLANEQGREVFAVPGSPLDPRAEGTNDLIRHGATLCTSADDVIDALDTAAAKTIRPGFGGPRFDEAGWAGDDPLSFDDAEFDMAPSADPGRELPPDVDDESRLLALMGPAPTPIDDLVRLSGLSAARIRAVLVDIEMAGRLERHGGSLVSLLAPRR